MFENWTESGEAAAKRFEFVKLYIKVVTKDVAHNARQEHKKGKEKSVRC